MLLLPEKTILLYVMVWITHLWLSYLAGVKKNLILSLLAAQSVESGMSNGFVTLQ